MMSGWREGERGRAKIEESKEREARETREEREEREEREKREKFPLPMGSVNARRCKHGLTWGGIKVGWGGGFHKGVV